MRGLRTLAVLMLAGMLLVGCLGRSSTVALVAEGPGADQNGRANCGTTATLVLDVAGDGSGPFVQVADGDGAVVFAETVGAGKREVALEGAAGEWTLSAKGGTGEDATHNVSLRC